MVVEVVRCTPWSGGDVSGGLQLPGSGIVVVVSTSHGELSHCQSATPIVAALPSAVSQSGFHRVKKRAPWYGDIPFYQRKSATASLWPR